MIESAVVGKLLLEKSAESFIGAVVNKVLEPLEPSEVKKSVRQCTAAGFESIKSSVHPDVLKSIPHQNKLNTERVRGLLADL